jgi:menaquinol-cytochrome c reductase iron-sulfur subunit
LSHSSADASEGVQRHILTAQDDETAEEITRRTFMANATMTISGIIGVVLAVPILGSLLPPASSGGGNWSPLSAQDLDNLQKATAKPVKMQFTLTYQDAYLPPQQAPEYVWGIKVDADKFRTLRPDIFTGPSSAPNDGADVPYQVVNMGFVIFSPICPHLGCRFNWSDDQNKFMCPCHGSQYNFDGEHIAGPAPRGLDPLPFREQTGTAQVTWIQYQSNTPNRIVVSYQA